MHHRVRISPVRFEGGGGVGGKMSCLQYDGIVLWRKHIIGLSSAAMTVGSKLNYWYLSHAGNIL